MQNYLDEKVRYQNFVTKLKKEFPFILNVILFDGHYTMHFGNLYDDDGNEINDYVMLIYCKEFFYISAIRKTIICSFKTNKEEIKTNLSVTYVHSSSLEEEKINTFISHKNKIKKFISENIKNLYLYNSSVSISGYRLCFRPIKNNGKYSYEFRLLLIDSEDESNINVYDILIKILKNYLIMTIL
jgi:hypothetical protein